MDNSKQLLKSNAIWLVFILEVIIFAVASKGAFVSGGNIINISRQVSYYGIASIGMTFVILIAGIDLSIGSIITLVNVICAFMMVNMGLNMWSHCHRPAQRLHGLPDRHPCPDRHLLHPDHL